MNATFTFVFNRSGLANVCHYSHLEQLVSKTHHRVVTVEPRDVTRRCIRHKTGCRTKTHVQPRILLVVCVSCKIHSPRISLPRAATLAPCEGAGGPLLRGCAQRRGHTAFRGHTRRKDVYPCAKCIRVQRPLVNSPKELLRGDQRETCIPGCSSAHEAASWAGQEMQGARIRIIEPQEVSFVCSAPDKSKYFRAVIDYKEYDREIFIIRKFENIYRICFLIYSKLKDNSFISEL